MYGSRKKDEILQIKNIIYRDLNVDGNNVMFISCYFQLSFYLNQQQIKWIYHLVHMLYRPVFQQAIVPTKHNHKKHIKNEVWNKHRQLILHEEFAMRNISFETLEPTTQKHYATLQLYFLFNYYNIFI